ncbi:MAG TPA: Arc family DNA-binding protein [Rubrivivax sp.]|nr:Arc family DNA-binding protein [Rubrivivax sp.]HRY90336.1 Arc family DNA-binding protein [Rubrivivax sp.]HRZ61200.1 Arc family DNA-binding protein [Rubrivivax sp.]
MDPHIHFGGIMAVNLSIKDVPEAVAERLRQRAARNHRSLQGELMAIVEQAAAETGAPAGLRSPGVQAAGEIAHSRVLGWKTIEQLFAERRASGWTPDPSLARAPLGVDIIRADRDSR